MCETSVKHCFTDVQRFRNLSRSLHPHVRMHHNDQDTGIAHWHTVQEDVSHDWKVLRMRSVSRVHAVDGRQGRFTIADAPAWVNIIPVTPAGEIVCVRQFRHGTAEITTEIPGGIVEHGEDPRVAAERECREETGFAAEGEAILLGTVEPNPAFMSNACYTYLWMGCTKRGPQQLDANEDIDVAVVSFDAFVSMVRNGHVRHSLVLSALALYVLHTNGHEQWPIRKMTHE